MEVMLQSGTKLARWPAWFAVFFLGAVLGAGPAGAATMRVMESRPSAQAVMDGTETQFFVRFNGPVDHAASRLSVVQDGHVVQTLHPRLNSQPNVLYSGVRRLAPGVYALRWMTRSMQDHGASQGEIAFTVR